MNLKVTEVTPEVYVSADQIVSMEHETVNGGGYHSPSYRYSGTTITLTNGRKIYVSGMTPKEIIETIERKKKGGEGCKDNTFTTD